MKSGAMASKWVHEIDARDDQQIIKTLSGLGDLSIVSNILINTKPSPDFFMNLLNQHWIHHLLPFQTDPSD
jgi:hypothetical protein